VLSSVQKLQKRWYDQNLPEFEEREQVLVLLPSSTNKLVAQWQGPYCVLKRRGKVDYLTDLHDRRKRRRVYHVNMLWKWYAPSIGSYMAEELPVRDEKESGMMVRTQLMTKPTVGEQLGQEQHTELQRVLGEFSNVFQNKPGLTH